MNLKVVTIAPGITVTSARGASKHVVWGLAQTGRKTWLKDAYRRQQGLCHYCRTLMRPIRKRSHHTGWEARDPSLDHIIPLSKGGENVEANTLACCRQCNQRKGDMMPWDFMNQLAMERAEWRRMGLADKAEAVGPWAEGAAADLRRSA